MNIKYYIDYMGKANWTENTNTNMITCNISKMLSVGQAIATERDIRVAT